MSLRQLHWWVTVETVKAACFFLSYPCPVLEIGCTSDITVKNTVFVYCEPGKRQFNQFSALIITQNLINLPQKHLVCHFKRDTCQSVPVNISLQWIICKNWQQTIITIRLCFLCINKCFNKTRRKRNAQLWLQIKLNRI